MSTLLDRIRATGRRRDTPLGFAAGGDRGAPQPQLLLIVEVADAAAATIAIESGADALLLSDERVPVADVVAVAGEAPVGIRLAGATAEQAAAAASGGADFIVFDDETTEAAALLVEDLGFVLALSSTTDEEADREYLGSLQPLGLDAVLVGARDEQMTVRQQVATRRLVELVRKPLIITVTAPVGVTALEVWRGAGAVAVLSSGLDAAALAALADAVKAVPPPRRPSGDRPVALVSALHGELEDDSEM